MLLTTIKVTVESCPPIYSNLASYFLFLKKIKLSNIKINADYKEHLFTNYSGEET